jgi:hypothetical protein
MEQNEPVSREDLIAAWSLRFGVPPAKKLSSAVLRAALEYEAQCSENGGLTKRDLQRLRSSATGRSAAPSKRSRATPGTHLVREWNGRSYQVAGIEGGYVLDGQTYGSLSAVAKHITGAHWSGPRFFGVSA